MRILFFLVLLSIGVLLSCRKSNIKYPRTKRVNTVDVYFNSEVPDPYRWLENDTSEETANWVKEQNEVTFAYLEQIPFREKIKERLIQIWDYPKQSIRLKKNRKYFYYHNDGLQNQDILYISEHIDSMGKVLIDPNILSEDGTVAITNFNVSKNGKYLAYSVSRAGSDWMEIFVKDIEEDKVLNDHLKWIKFSLIAWHNDGFYYGKYDEPKKGKELSEINKYHKIYYHKVGTSQSEDKIIFVPENSNRNVYAQTTDDEKYLIIYETESTNGNNVRIKNLHHPGSPIIQLTTGYDYEYTVIEHLNDNLYIKTNYKAPNYKLIKININSLELRNWQDILPQKNTLLEKVILAGDKIIACYLENAKNSMKVYNIEGKLLTTIALPGIGTVDELSGRWNDDQVFFSFNTFTSPIVIYEYDMKENTTNEVFVPEIDIDLDAYETEQVFYSSKDGTQIPMFLVHKKGIQKDGNTPVLLYGYGGFNISMTPYFSTSRLIWLENGGIFALPNIRGGGEFGENWHKAGTKLNKQNVFDDFISAAEYLINENYTNLDLLAIYGGSNGGLLVGAVTNQRPDLFKIAIPEVGVMDMLRFHKFTIGWAWTGDYGSSEDSIMFEYLYSYSPLHNISEEKEYPAVLAFTADHDDRVVPAHSFKYIATLQQKYKGPNPVLIRIQTKAGHGRGTPTNMLIEQATDMWAFTFYNMNISPNY